MTTICCLKAKDFCLVASDTQVSQGNLKLPLRYSKIARLTDSILVGSAGSVSESQILPRQCLRSLRQARVSLDLESDDIHLNDFVREFAEYLFSLRLKLKHYSPNSFIIAGLDEHAQPTILSLDGDGSLLKIPSFWAIGSGSELALSVLNNGYDENHILKDALKLVMDALASSTSFDIFTNNQFEIYLLTPDGIRMITQEDIKELPSNE